MSSLLDEGLILEIEVGFDEFGPARHGELVAELGQLPA
jgi:hypothetical protein